MPPWWYGWHLLRRTMPSQKPLGTPWISMACRMYSEQVGWKRQAEGSHGEISFLYPRRAVIQTDCSVERAFRSRAPGRETDTWLQPGED